MTRLLNLLYEAEGGADQEEAAEQVRGADQDGGADQIEKRRPFDKLLQATEYGSTRFQKFSKLSCGNF